jgi:hypothetical protein
MKITDQTPYFNPETGEISFTDRIRAMMKYGSTWIAEIQAQKSVMTVLDKVLDKNFTVLRNATLADLDASIPLILIGPPGVYVIYVTPIQGTYRAKGDQWGTISGSSFKDEKPNLLTRTERMARAVQIYLQRQGYMTLTGVEAVLLCSDPGVHVDSLRPIVRVVMRDALERFAASLTQARLVLSPEAVHDISNRILNPPKPAAPKPLAEAAAAAGGAGYPGEASITDLPQPQSATGGAPSWSPDRLGFDFLETNAPQNPAAPPPPAQPVQAPSQVEAETDVPLPFPLPDQPVQAPPEAFPLPEGQLSSETTPASETQPRRARRPLSRRQWILLIIIVFLEVVLVASFAFLVLRNL